MLLWALSGQKEKNVPYNSLFLNKFHHQLGWALFVDVKGDGGMWHCMIHITSYITTLMMYMLLSLVVGETEGIVLTTSMGANHMILTYTLGVNTHYKFLIYITLLMFIVKLVTGTVSITFVMTIPNMLVIVTSLTNGTIFNCYIW